MKKDRIIVNGEDLLEAVVDVTLVVQVSRS